MRAKPSHVIAAATAIVVALVAAITVTVLFVRSNTDTSPGPRAGVSTPVSGLPTVQLQQLPTEAHTTLELIDKGGPFPYRQDGSTFRNQENLLPRQATGYYREYTVKTPGSSDRGARRLVAGRDGDIYYTADHYETFRQVLR